MTDPFLHLLRSQTRLWAAIALLAIGEIVLALCIGGCGDITAVDTGTQGDPASRGGTTGKADAGNPVSGIVDAGTNRNDVAGDSQPGGSGGNKGDAGLSVQETGDGATSGAPETGGNPMVDGGMASFIGQRCGNYGTPYYIACCKPGDDCAARYGKRDAWCDCAINPPAEGYTTCDYKAGTFGSLHPTECVFTQ